MSIKSKTVYIIIGALLMLVVILAAGLVVAQNTVRAQRWEYAIVIWDVSDNTFTLRISQFYEAMEFVPATDREATEELWGIMAQVESAGVFDYLAIMGLSGYELADVTNVGDAFLYTFKRPEKQ